MLKIIVLSVICSMHVQLLCAQKHTISGYVKDGVSGETLIGATLSVKGLSKGITTNAYGFYSISIPGGSQGLEFSYVGYQPAALSISLRKDTILNITLFPLSALTQEVVVTAQKSGNVKSAQMGRVSLPVEQIKSIPAFLGEVDLLKTIQLLPGIRNAGEGTAGIYVRGGGADQNLIILDDAVVYNTGHLFGFFSIFNADAIKNVTLIKGGMPSQYGGRLSSVLDISMKEGNNQKFQAEGGIGLVASRFSIQGPVVKNKSSFILSGRRTYVDALVKPFVKKESQFYGSGYYFYDLNAKFNYQFSEKDRLYISGYFGRDVFDFRNAKLSFKVNIPWGNATGTLRWNHVFNNKLFANTTLVYNDYNFRFSGSQNDFEVKMNSGIRDLNAKTDIDFYPASNHKLKFGALYTYHKFTPSVVSGRQDSMVFKPLNAQVKFAHEAALYVQDDWDISAKIRVHLGLRYSLFQQIGPYKIYTTDSDGNRTDSTVFGKGKAIKTFSGLEPRFTIRYSLN